MSDIDPSEVAVQGKRLASDAFGPEIGDGLVAPVTSSRGEREGLPSGYRMRADAHYVDQLASRKADRDAQRSQAVSADSLESAADVDPRDRRGDRILAQLQEELITLSSATSMLGNSSALARRLGTDLVRAQTWRALWLVKAHALVEGRERAHPRPRVMGSIVETLRQGLTAECRLAGLSLQVAATDWNATVNVDESVLVAGVTGAVVATLGLTGQTDAGGAVRISFEVAGTDLRAVEVSQEEVPPPSSVAVRFFDLAWVERPGGWVAGIGAASARAAAQLHGGSATLLTVDRRGTTVRLGLSRLH